MFDFLEPFFFGLFALGIIGAGAAVVTLRRITAQALLMALTFACMAGMFLLLGAETIALFQVLIYVGAITILILFGVIGGALAFGFIGVFLGPTLLTVVYRMIEQWSRAPEHVAQENRS